MLFWEIQQSFCGNIQCLCNFINTQYSSIYLPFFNKPQLFFVGANLKSQLYPRDTVQFSKFRQIFDTIDVSGFTNGMLIIKIESDEGFLVEKIVKE